MRSYDMNSDRMQANRARIPLYITMSADPRTKAEKVIKNVCNVYNLYLRVSINQTSLFSHLSLTLLKITKVVVYSFGSVVSFTNF